MSADDKRREAVLREMGIHPVWRLKATDAVPAGEEASAGESASGSRVSEMDWSEIRESIASCTACSLSHGRNKVVVGTGSEKADWFFIGEAPGAEEDIKGEPFVGQAGRLLDNMLATIGLSRQNNVYIANTVKCRPPGNRNPEPGEMAACRPYLLRQIELVKPALIVILGRIAAHSVLDTDAPISALRGACHAFMDVPVVVTYHPAYLLRNPADKAKAWEDLCFARKTMSESVKR